MTMPDTHAAQPGRTSLVMATFRRTHCIGETVRQLLDAQTRPPYEIIVVNNDPAPGAEAAVRAALPNDPRIRVTSCVTGKQGACRNLGLTLATGDYVAFVDDDDDYAPTYIAALAGALDLGLRSVRSRIQTCGMAGPDCTGTPTIAHHPLTPNTMARRDALTPTWGEPPSEDRDYWARHPVQGAIDDCLVFTCRGPQQHSPRNAAQGGSWRHRFVVQALFTRDDARALPTFVSALREQRYAHFVCELFDATADDRLARPLARIVAEDARFRVRTVDAQHVVRDRLLAMGSAAAGADARADAGTPTDARSTIHAHAREPELTWQADDVLVMLRVNERLAHAGVLTRLAHVYGEHDDIWATFGACTTEPFTASWPQASFPPATWSTRAFRAHAGVIGEYAPLTVRASLATALAVTSDAHALAPAAGATVSDDDADLPLFLAVLERAGASHVYPMADVQVIKSLTRSAYTSATARQASIARQFEIRAREVLPVLHALPDMGATAPVSESVTAPVTDPITWIGPVYDPSGYGNELRQFVLALDNLGTRAVLRAAGNHSPRFQAAAGAALRDRLDVMLAEPQGADATTIVHLPPSFLQRLPGARYMIARTMFETDGLPAAFVQRCNTMDELWVPSAFNVETFRKAGVRAHMVEMPGAIDSARFHSGHAPLVVPGVHGTVYLSTIEWKSRKGWQTLLDAWAEAFAPGDDVTLLIRASIPGHTESDSAPEIWRQIDAHLATRKRTRAQLATIVVMGRAIGDDDVPRLYATAQAYVAATSGEGWGYPYMEAMASGLPTIATRWSGNLAFMHDDNSLLCDVERLVPAIDAFVGDMPGQRWALPSARHLASLLRTVVDDPARVRTLADTAKHEMRTRWTWQHAAARVQERLAELAERRGAAQRMTHGVTQRETQGVTPTTTAAAPHVAPDTRSIPVRWEGPQFTHASLGLVNREVCAQLHAAGDIDLLVRPTQAHDFTPEPSSPLAPLWQQMRQRVTHTPRAAAVHVAHQWPPVFDAPREGAWVLMQPWEYGGLPGSWIPLIRDQVDEYWVYCSWQRSCAIDSGIPADKVHIIPLGTDPTRYRPDGPRYPLATKKRTKLLAVGGIIPRKGMDLLVSTYLKTFTAQDDVCLVIKGLSARWAYQGNPGQTDFAALPALAAAEGAAEIEFIGDTLDDDAVASLYRACDALVAPFRGEGFGLPVVEAMASGLPVIVTHAGPMFDLCDHDTAFLVPAGQSPVSQGIAGAAPGRLGFWWADPDTTVLAQHMRQVVSDPAHARAVGARARARVLERFTHAHTAAAVTARVRVLATRTPVREAAAAPFTPDAVPFPLDQPRGVVFVHAPEWHHDAWRDVVQAFLRTFSQGDDVSLVLAHDPAQGMDEAQIAADIAALREACGRTEADSPDLLLVPGDMSDTMLASLYAGADCVLVAPRDASARVRAAAMGVPVASAGDELRVVYEHAHGALVADAHFVT
jgi:glycosyltransferase involved in cell wall biosynthesis